MHPDDRPPTKEHNPTRLSRRHFLERGALAAGSVAVLSVTTELPGLAEAAGHAAAAAYAPAALAANEMATLKAILDRLIPKDRVGPSATQAHVHIYIDRALAGAYRSLLPSYQRYLPLFDKAAKSLGRKSFTALSAKQKDALLKEFQAGKLPGATSADPQLAGLFQLLLEHMREGMFADPMYGGNYKFAGWNLIGYPGVQLVYTAQQQAIGTKVRPAHTSARAFGGKPYNGPTV
jgi:gluconate 2-dehydrogenase gamma chain